MDESLSDLSGNTSVIRKYWKMVLGILIGFIAIVVLILQFTRSVRPFEPPEDRHLTAWGSVNTDVALELQSILDRDVNQIKVPGLQAFIRTPDGKTWSGSSGTTDLARKNLLQRDHVIRVGSVTKSFTAVLILKLVEEGRLSLDTPVSEWFPDMPSADGITIRHLLNHTSGIPEIIPKVLLKSIIPWTFWGPEELVDLIIKDELQFTPGAKFSYSNSNYILLGLIAEKVSGKPINQLLHEQIIGPLELKHTYFIPYETAPIKLVTGFDRDMASIPGMLTIGTDNTSWATSAFTSGAMASTAEDLGIFFERLSSGVLLSPPTVEEMTTFIYAPNPGFPEQTGYGLGLMQIEVNGQELFGHAGQFMGSTAIAMHSPDENYTIVVTCNLSNPNLVEVLIDFQDIIK